MAETHAISLQDVTAGYRGPPILQNVTVNVAEGEFLGVLGPNGCGKTTLLRVISGTLAAQNGRVWLRGRDLRELDRRQLARNMACLLQDHQIDFPFTVGELVLMGRSPHIPRFGRESKRDVEVAQYAMTQADVVHLADRPITSLSGGERQRAFIAMCLAQEPRILLLDEPTNHLDIRHQLSVLDLVRKLNHEARLSVVAVFHDFNMAAQYCDRVMLLDQGNIVALGSPQHVLTVETIRAVFGVTVSVQCDPSSRKAHVVILGGKDGGHAGDPDPACIRAGG